MDTDDQALWRSLQPLRSTNAWLMLGAHPDDEWNGFLAWLALGRGVHTVYACATRGEGGQNALGPERGRALGALRSREMALAAAEIELALQWLGRGPAHGEDDPIFDFGFSKSAEDTLNRWGEQRLLDRLVRLIRSERPDAISPTFLDVPGQHGHHRAITRTTLRAAAYAADPVYPCPLAVWRVAKLYLPAFSGAGASYDDRAPPPQETTRVDLGEICPELGLSWAQIGENSRRLHASQGMGRDLPPGPRPFKLHLAEGLPDAQAPMDGLAHRLSDLADSPGAQALRDADAAIDVALHAFPDRTKIQAALNHARAILSGINRPDIAHRLARIDRQIARILGNRASEAVPVAPPGLRARSFHYPHTGPVTVFEPTAPRILRGPIAIPTGARVGVATGPVDETLGWLHEINLAAEAVDDATLASGDLSRFTTLLIGIFGFGQRPALRAHRDRLMAWMQAGGSLVTLYHRPEDGWENGHTPPYHLLPGRPSFRWRVTDPATPVRLLQPNHPLLNAPNRLTEADWSGWVRERGLYFASEWSPAYTPLIELADAQEPPHRGALLTARVGQGRHTHVALALHHQLEACVPGAFKLLANLMAPTPAST